MGNESINISKKEIFMCHGAKITIKENKSMRRTPMCAQVPCMIKVYDHLIIIVCVKIDKYYKYTVYMYIMPIRSRVRAQSLVLFAYIVFSFRF